MNTEKRGCPSHSHEPITTSYNPISGSILLSNGANPDIHPGLSSLSVGWLQAVVE